MKLAYITILWKPSHGIISKLCHVSQAIKQHELPIDVILIAPEAVLCCIPKESGILTRLISLPWPKTLWRNYYSYSIWRKLGDELDNYDALVIRWTVPSPSFLNFTKKHRIFTEHHTKEIPELESKTGLSNWLLKILEQRYASRILSNVKGIIGVTDEIIQYELSRIQSAKPNITISNGITVETIEPIKLPPYTGDMLNMAFVSNRFDNWQGLDRVLSAMSAYKSEPLRLVLHVVGSVTAAQRNEINHLGLGRQVILYGQLMGDKLTRVLSKCHFAFSSLAVQRKGLTQACALKTREYTARGLPFVLAYEDPDFTDALPWVHMIPADEGPIDINQLLTFVKTIDYSTVANDMRQYADTHLAWSKKLRLLYDFVEQNIDAKK